MIKIRNVLKLKNSNFIRNSNLPTGRQVSKLKIFVKTIEAELRYFSEILNRF